MEINHIRSSPDFKPLIEFKVGQRVLIEVISTSENGQSVVKLGGRQIPASLELPAKIGEEFWTVVRENNQNGLILARVDHGDPNIGNNPMLNVRGLPQNTLILNLLQGFIENRLSLQTILKSDSQLLREIGIGEVHRGLTELIPRWDTISSNTIVQTIYELFKALGMDYENRLYRMFIRQEDTDQRKKEIESLKNTLKAKLIDIDNEDKSITEFAEKLLQSITAQQLWIDTGIQDHAYFIFELPLFCNRNFYQARIAVESARQGNKIDMNHCHIGIEVETDNLGTIGVDVWLFENQMRIRMLSNDETQISQMLNSPFSYNWDRIESMGYSLSVDVGNLSKNVVFHNFIRGGRVKEVDLKG